MSEQRKTADSEARLYVVEEQLGRLERSVTALSDSIGRYITEQAQAPRAIPFKEIITTAGITFALFVAGLQFLDQRQELATRDMRSLLAIHAKQLERLAPVTYSHRPGGDRRNEGRSE